MLLDVRVYDKDSNVIEMERNADGLTGMVDYDYLINAVKGDANTTRIQAHETYGSVEADFLPIEILC